jgi:hypothetical protein
MPDVMTRWVPFKDLVAGVATIGLLAGVIVLVVLGVDVPAYLSAAFTVAMGWVFRGGAQLQNELSHRNKESNGS